MDIDIGHGKCEGNEMRTFQQQQYIYLYFYI